MNVWLGFRAEVFAYVFRQSGEEKQKVKIITLLSDLILEKSDLELRESLIGDNGDKERLRQYKEVPLLETLVEKGWCSLMPQLLEIPDLDSQEKILKAMRLTYDSCRQEFLNSKQELKALKESYKTQWAQDKDNDYLESLLAIVEHMLETWKPKDEL